MIWFKIDENLTPVPCKNAEEFHRWHQAMPDSGHWYESKTGCGMSIAKDTLASGEIVSTVFLGLNHAFGEGKPVLWETMVFPMEDEWSESFAQRYRTYSEAVEGHRKLVQERTP